MMVISQMSMYACGSEAQVECFSRFVKCMDESVKQLCGTMERSAKRYEECKYDLHYFLCVDTICFLPGQIRLLLPY